MSHLPTKSWIPPFIIEEFVADTNLVCAKSEMFPVRDHTIKQGSRAWKTDKRGLRYFCATCGDRLETFSFISGRCMPQRKKVELLKELNTS